METRTPVLLLVWKRPERTKKLLAILQNRGVGTIYVSGDGPRPGYSEEIQLVEETRRVVYQASDTTPVRTRFATKHLGLQRSIVEGIDWFFQSEDEGIILEDDLVPHNQFWSFMERGLREFRDQKRVSQIAGTNYSEAITRESASPHFSVFQHIWGFATWANRWSGFSDFMRTGRVTREAIESAYPSMTASFHRHWYRRVQAELDGSKDTWTASWNFFSAARARVSFVPPHTLVSNIGYGPDATNSHRVPLVAGSPPRPPSDPEPISVDDRIPIFPDRARDTFVATTQWATQPALLRYFLAFLEWFRRRMLHQSRSNSSIFSQGRRQAQSFAQKYFARRIRQFQPVAPPSPESAAFGLSLGSTEAVDQLASLAVLVIGWKRPLETAALLEKLRKAGIKRVYVSLDGPSPWSSVTNSLRDEVVDCVNWESNKLDLKMRMNAKKLGLKTSVVQAIDWFFSHESSGLILEDDCDPKETAFLFFDNLLRRYRSDPGISQVAGSSHLRGAPVPTGGIYLSRFHHIWGFATWRESWEGFSHFINRPEPIEKNALEMAVPGFPSSFYRHWISRVKDERSGRSDTWDSSWNMFNLLRGSRSVTPLVSVVQNIGFGKNATNSKKVPLVAGYPPQARDGAWNWPLKTLGSEQADLLDLYVGMTQWATQSLPLRTGLAALEWLTRKVRQTNIRVARDRGDEVVNSDLPITWVQKYYRKLVWPAFPPT